MHFYDKVNQKLKIYFNFILNIKFLFLLIGSDLNKWMKYLVIYFHLCILYNVIIFLLFHLNFRKADEF